MTLTLTPPPGRPAAVAAGAVALFGLLLGSFLARNPDVWLHLAGGRDVVRLQAFGPTWLFDLLAYATYSVAGGAGLVGAKAAAVAAVGGLIAVAGRARGGWRLAAACGGLATLAVGMRAGVQPATLGCLLLALIVWHLGRSSDRAPEAEPVWPGWPLVLLVLAWANADRWAVVGVATVALAWAGRGLDLVAAADLPRYFKRRLLAVGVLALAAAASPSHVRGLMPPADLFAPVAGDGGGWLAGSPFAAANRAAFADSPAALAFYPLAGFGLLSFVLVRGGFRWERFLPWAAAAALASVQTRAVPFFAVVGGPVLAWNLADLFARRGVPERVPKAVAVAGSAAALLFLAAAWAGWLQSPPYGARQWKLDLPAGVEQAAAAVRGWHADGRLPAGSRTLHLTPDTAHAFRWFCPEDAAAVGDPDTSDGADRVVVHAADRRLPPGAVERLLDDGRWRPLYLAGGVAVFGRADAAYGLSVDLDRLAFRPTADESAPAAGPDAPPARHWADDLLTPPPPTQSADRDQAALLLVMAEAARRAAPVRHLADWEATQVAGLVGWPAGPADAAYRLLLARPPLPDDDRDPPAVTQTVLGLQRRFQFVAGDAPAGPLYAAVRAARRAIAANPADAAAHQSLGQAYVRLLGGSAERAWAEVLPQIGRLRRVQAAAALRQAVALNPAAAPAHLDLARVYQTLDCFDLAAVHLRAYRDLVARGRGAEAAAGVAREVDAVEKLLAAQSAEYEAEAARGTVADRALAAARRGLGGRALDTLLASDLAAFGIPGVRLELDLLLRTGRAAEAKAWTDATPEVRGSLGETGYHWTRGQTLAAVGDYAAADAALAELTNPTGRLTAPAAVAPAVALAVGRWALAEAAGTAAWPHATAVALARNDAGANLGGVVDRLADEADVATVRGLVALEAGEIGRAREAFLDALRYAPAGLAPGGRRAAEAALRWIDEPAAGR